MWYKNIWKPQLSYSGWNLWTLSKCLFIIWHVLNSCLFYCCKSYYKWSVISRRVLTLSIPRIISAAFSAIIIVGACVFPDVIWRMTEASTTRKLSTPLTLKTDMDNNRKVFWRKCLYFKFRNFFLHFLTLIQMKSLKVILHWPIQLFHNGQTWVEGPRQLWGHQVPPFYKWK